MLKVKTPLFRKFRRAEPQPGEANTIYTQIQTATGPITITLSPDDQEIILSGIRSGLMMTDPELVGGTEERLEKHVRYRSVLSKFEDAVLAVGLNVVDLEGVTYEDA